jgi:hypothetical protein
LCLCVKTHYSAFLLRHPWTNASTKNKLWQVDVNSQQIPGIPACFRGILAQLVLTQAFKNGLTAHARVNSSPDWVDVFGMFRPTILANYNSRIAFLARIGSQFFSITENLVGGFNMF